MLFENTLKEILDLQNEARLGRCARPRPLDGIGGGRIERSTKIDNLIEARPFHRVGLQVRTCETVFRVDVQATEEMERVVLAIDRASAQQQNARRLV